MANVDRFDRLDNRVAEMRPRLDLCPGFAGLVQAGKHLQPALVDERDNYRIKGVMAMVGTVFFARPQIGFACPGGAVGKIAQHAFQTPEMSQLSGINSLASQDVMRLLNEAS